MIPSSGSIRLLRSVLKLLAKPVPDDWKKFCTAAGLVASRLVREGWSAVAFCVHRQMFHHYSSRFPSDDRLTTPPFPAIE